MRSPQERLPPFRPSVDLAEDVAEYDLSGAPWLGFGGVAGISERYQVHFGTVSDIRDPVRRHSTGPKRASAERVQL